MMGECDFWDQHTRLTRGSVGEQSPGLEHLPIETRSRDERLEILIRVCDFTREFIVVYYESRKRVLKRSVS